MPHILVHKPLHNTTARHLTRHSSGPVTRHSPTPPPPLHAPQWRKHSLELASLWWFVFHVPGSQLPCDKLALPNHTPEPACTMLAVSFCEPSTKGSPIGGRPPCLKKGTHQTLCAPRLLENIFPKHTATRTGETHHQTQVPFHIAPKMWYHRSLVPCGCYRPLENISNFCGFSWTSMLCLK